MKFGCRLLPAALLFGVAAASAADPSVDRAAAAAAFESGDYLSAVQLYSRSREAAARSGDDRAWIADTVAMARAHLHHDSPARARQLLAEFNQRYSVNDYGILEGEILAAEGKIAEAEKFFRELIAAPGVDPRIRGEAELALTYLLLRSGDSGKAAEALNVLTRLEEDEHFATEARLRRIYALIRDGKAAQALELAGRTTFGTAPPRRRLELLKLLALLHTGAADDFDSGWKTLRGEMPGRPDKLALETLELAAAQAMKSSHPDRAAFYWEDAYHYADGDEVRRDILRKHFNCCAKFDAKQAAQVARRYAELFPDSDNAGQLVERARMLIGAGELLCADKEYRQALDFFRTVADDSKMPTAERRDAARAAALAAEEIDDQEAARRYYESLISTAQEPRQQQSAQLLYADYLIRRKDHSGAEKMVRSITDLKDPKLKDRAGRLLVETLVAQNKSAAALAAASELRRSADPGSAGFGEYYTALMLEKLERPAEARKGYLDYIRRFPQGEFVRPARFAAAKTAEECGDHAAAAKDFLAYGKAYPDDPDAVGAFFWALRDGGLAEDLPTALAAFEALKGKAGVGEEYYAAVLQLMDFMRRSGKASEALALWETADRAKCRPAEAAMLELMRAKLLASARRRTEAIAAAEQLLNDHPAEPAAADAAFLAGELYLEAENPAKALEMMLKAGKLRPTGDFADAVAARAADCRLEQFRLSGVADDLAAAAKEYARLAAEAGDPNIRLMCHYKLGWCREAQKDTAAAVRAYHQALLFAGGLKRARRPFDPKWCSRSAYAALNLLLNHPLRNADQSGAAIIDAIEALELPGGDAEFETVRNEFYERYWNRNREI